MGTLKPGVGLIYERVDGVVYGRHQGKTDRWEIGRTDMKPISPNDISTRTTNNRLGLYCWTWP